jgi:hypothetical protein
MPVAVRHVRGGVAGVWQLRGTNGYDGAYADAYATFPVPLASGLDGAHTIYVSRSSATHCSGPGHADPGYLCVYQGDINNTITPQSPGGLGVFNPEAPNGPAGTGTHGWAIPVEAFGSSNSWFIGGSWAVTAP